MTQNGCLSQYQTDFMIAHHHSPDSPNSLTNSSKFASQQIATPHSKPFILKCGYIIASRSTSTRCWSRFPNECHTNEHLALSFGTNLMKSSSRWFSCFSMACNQFIVCSPLRCGVVLYKLTRHHNVRNNRTAHNIHTKLLWQLGIKYDRFSRLLLI